MTLATLARPTIAAVTLALVGSLAHAESPKHVREVELSIAHTDSQPVRIEGFNGGIEIRAQEGDTVSVHAKLYGPNKDRVDQAVMHTEREKDGTLHIWSEWPSNHKGSEGVALTILIPNTAGIRADTSNGPISISGLAGPYTLGTSNAGIEVVSAIGDVRADTSNGTITVNGAPGTVNADTSNGSIRIAGATGPVNADSSNGNIEVALDSSNAGPVIADTSNGSIVLAVGPSFGGSMVADTSNGKVRFGPFSEEFAATVTSAKNDTVRATFGTATHKSRLDTSNGQITVKPTSAG